MSLFIQWFAEVTFNHESETCSYKLQCPVSSFKTHDVGYLQMFLPFICPLGADEHLMCERETSTSVCVCVCLCETFCSLPTALMRAAKAET